MNGNTVPANSESSAMMHSKITTICMDINRAKHKARHKNVRPSGQTATGVTEWEWECECLGHSEHVMPMSRLSGWTRASGLGESKTNDEIPEEPSAFFDVCSSRKQPSHSYLYQCKAHSTFVVDVEEPGAAIDWRFGDLSCFPFCIWMAGSGHEIRCLSSCTKVPSQLPDRSSTSQSHSRFFS